MNYWDITDPPPFQGSDIKPVGVEYDINTHSCLLQAIQVAEKEKARLAAEAAKVRQEAAAREAQKEAAHQEATRNREAKAIQERKKVRIMCRAQGELGRALEP